MAKTAKIEVKEQGLVESMQGVFRTLLEKGDINALLVPQRLPMKNAVMPTLVTDPEKINGADPLAPVFPINAAKVVSKKAHQETPAWQGGSGAAALRDSSLRRTCQAQTGKDGGSCACGVGLPWRLRQC
jgi:formate dehydrogenase subunit beta